MTRQQTATQENTDKSMLRMQENDKLMETLHILADGSLMSRQLLDHLLAQYSWDGYVNELEFE